MTDDHYSLDLVKFDWVIGATGYVLHSPVSVDENEALCWQDVKMACGRTLQSVSIPGITTRMYAKRCDRCCDARGYPRGTGSPKNDNEIRLLEG